MGKAIAHEIIQLCSHRVRNPSNHPKFLSILINEIIPLMRQDKINGTIISAQRAANFGTLPKILGVGCDMSIYSSSDPESLNYLYRFTSI